MCSLQKVCFALHPIRTGVSSRKDVDASASLQAVDGPEEDAEACGGGLDDSQAPLNSNAQSGVHDNYAVMTSLSPAGLPPSMDLLYLFHSFLHKMC